MPPVEFKPWMLYVGAGAIFLLAVYVAYTQGVFYGMKIENCKKKI